MSIHRDTAPQRAATSVASLGCSVAEDLAAEAEKIVLGSMMIDPSVVESVIAHLSSRDFHKPAHTTVFNHLVAAWSAGEPAEPVALGARLAAAGDLARVGGLSYLHTLIAAVPTVANAGHYAGIVAAAAVRRRIAEAGTRLAQASTIDDPERLSTLVESVRSDLAGATKAATGPTAPRAAPINWSSFMVREFGPVDFLAGRLMVRGEQIALVGDGKAGKSLFAQEWMWRICAGLPFLGDGPHAPLRVLYVDQENTEDEIQERLLSFGADAETLRNLTYLSFPQFRALNTVAGAGDLLAAVDEHRPAVVVFDTISRMVDGKENDADPWRDLYRLTLIPLKARKISSIRLDHFGKDAARGARGNSAKTQDVDGVWELAATEKGSSLLRLTRTHTRTGKGPGELLLSRHGEQVGDRWKVGGTWHGIADETEMPTTVPDHMAQFRPAARRILGVLGTSPEPLTVRQVGDALAAQTDGPLKQRTIQDALRTLADAGIADEMPSGPGKPALWMASAA